MSKDKLDIFERARGRCYAIGWYLADDQDFGLILGNITHDGGPESNAAIAAIRALPEDLHPRDIMAIEWEWDTFSAVQKALRAARAAIKLAVSNRPMPPWAVTALANGWKAPRGWKP